MSGAAVRWYDLTPTEALLWHSHRLGAVRCDVSHPDEESMVRHHLADYDDRLVVAWRRTWFRITSTSGAGGARVGLAVYEALAGRSYS